MPIEWNKVTWYSKLLAVVLAVVIFYVGFKLGGEKKEISTMPPVTPEAAAPIKSTPISITTKDIKEENFTGKVAVVSGPGLLPTTAQIYIDKTVADFRTQANTDVPSMRAQFGADGPTANYEIDIDATHITSPKTESVVLRVYTYTGGAHGSSLYKVFTYLPSEGAIIPLSSVIKSEEQNTFTEFVRKQLNAWKPEGSTASPVFPEDVNALTFDSFTNWSLDDKNLILYFDQYEVGPGVLGEVAFPLPLPKVKDFLNSGFIGF